MPMIRGCWPGVKGRRANQRPAPISGRRTPGVGGREGEGTCGSSRNPVAVSTADGYLLCMDRAPHRLTLDIDDAPVSVTVRRSTRARRMTLRVEAAEDGVVLVLPYGTSLAEGLDFISEHAVWIRNRLLRLPPRVRFTDGAVIPLLGVDHRVRHRPDTHGGVRIEGGEIHVTGHAEHLPRRLEDWLRAEARRELTARSRNKAARIGRRVRHVTVRDTRSRWGSCAASGNLSYSWRLILAPERVLDYVVAHEVAHLAEMNHGPRFRALLETLVDDIAGPRTWLRRHGPRLHRYG